MRVVSSGGTGTGTAVARTVDAAAPTSSDDWIDDWTATSPVVVTTTSTDDGSGLASEKYCVDTADTCSPATEGTSVSVTCASGSVCTQYVRYNATDNVGNASSTYSKRVRQDLEDPTASDDWTDSWTATSPVNITLSYSDGSGSASIKYCVDTANTCTPTTEGTAVSVTCASGSVCTQYVRYKATDSAGNTSPVYSKRVRQDLEDPTCTDDWTDDWTASSTVDIVLSSSDGTGSGLASTKYCVDTADTCTPATAGTAVSITCDSGSTCIQYCRYVVEDNVGNSNSYSKRVRQDLQNPSDGTLTATEGSQQVDLSWSGFSDAGSGLATVDTYKLVFDTSAVADCNVGTQIYLGTSTTYLHSGLTDGTTYYYRSCAFDALSHMSAGATAQATPSSCSCEAWSACGSCSYDTTCATSGTGTQTRTCTPAACDTESQSCTCTRSTEGNLCYWDVCGSGTACSYSDICDTTKGGTRQGDTCDASGNCPDNNTNTQACNCETRETLGVTCADTTTCSGSYSSTCDETCDGTQTSYECDASEECVGSDSSCSCGTRSTTDVVCDMGPCVCTGAGCSYSDVCDNVGSCDFCGEEYYKCSAESCNATNTFLVGCDTCSCARDTNGVACTTTGGLDGYCSGGTCLAIQ